jgi:hypothetical protein
MTTPNLHYHLHDESGACYGDSDSFESAALCAALYTYPWCVPDNEPVEGFLIVVEADFCIDQCPEIDDE